MASPHVLALLHNMETKKKKKKKKKKVGGSEDAADTQHAARVGAWLVMTIALVDFLHDGACWDVASVDSVPRPNEFQKHIHAEL